ncbi:MAG: hypothetical protein GXP36_10570 [Actinobacteria bacterium]|nr:hypothetical protein [Actinomycetota bacterium]
MVSRHLVGGLLAFTLVAAACTARSDDRATLETISPLTTTSSTTTSTSTSTTSTTTTTIARFSVTGTVITTGGDPLAGVTITAADSRTMTNADGSFVLDGALLGSVTASRPAWLSTEVVWDGEPTLSITMAPRVVRAIRVSRAVAPDKEAFDRILAIADATTVNALVFDTKDESGYLLYNSKVPKAAEIGANRDVYDPVAYIAQAKDRGLYTITRIVTFEDAVWSKGDPGAALAGTWINATDKSNWEYPLALAAEACELGFDEIQFDYIRFPDGKTAARVRQILPMTQAQRIAVVQEFLAEARTLLHGMGCAISADIFGIVMASPTDEGIGQRPEELSTVTDALSPMLYPSHYGPGWIGFDDPNDYPGPVVAHSLDLGMARLEGTALIRPWLQGFYYSPDQVLAQITEAENRGLGWIIWNANGNYELAWFPVDSE